MHSPPLPVASFRPRLRHFAALVLSLLLGLLLGLASPVTAQDSREAMWPAPTVEDWKKPVLIQWQRTWDDAVALSKETGKAILVCINMDGEIASEHYAGIRYRQPEITKLYEPYVTVIASVYRHNPRDYDEHGQRIPCPRFGCVTCGEHIAIEPLLFEKFMDGRRIAPRHIMVELDGAETYDVFYAFDTASVFKAIGDGIANRTTWPIPIVRGDRSILERVASADSVDRAAVEQAYAQGDQTQRRALLEAALAQQDKAPIELLRQAVLGFDLELSKMARQGLAKAESPSAVDLINETLRVPMEASERDALIAALGRLGESSPRARTLAVVHRGLQGRSTTIDTESWSKALGGGSSYAAAVDRQELLTRLEGVAEAAKDRPKDATAHLELAEATLAQAIDPATAQALANDPRTADKYQRLMYEDAQRAGLDAQRLGATAWRTSAVLAVSAYHLGDLEQAYTHAEAAMGGKPADAQSLTAMAMLAIFAESRQVAIANAVRDKQPWPPQWLTDIHAAYSVLARHPFGTATHVVWHHDFLKALGGAGRAARILDEGLARFPDSWVLHDRLRSRILEEKGVTALEATYDAMLEQENASQSLAWFAGYSSLVAAEFHRRSGDEAEALAAYGRGIAQYQRFIQQSPESKAGADHYIAVAMGGRARVALERGDLDTALAEVLASFEQAPDSAATLDGLNISTVDTAKMLGARLREAQRTVQVASLEAALAKLDPEMLRLPAYERETPPGGDGSDQRPRRRRGRDR